MLARVHAVSNRRKHLAYWIGFLKGVLASGKVEQLEFAPLRAEAEAFLLATHDDDAAELLRDLETTFEDQAGEIKSVIECIVEMRCDALGPEEVKDKVNSYFGFCAGIACDNRINLREVERLIEETSAVASVCADPRVASIERAARLAIADGQITPDEQADITRWIARLVGDSASDTGLATFGNGCAVGEEYLTSPEAIVFNGSCFVVTGQFSIAPRKVLVSLIAERGGVVKPAVTRDTEYLVVAAAASRDWRFSHAGTKLQHALELRTTMGRPHLVPETTFRVALGSAL